MGLSYCRYKAGCYDVLSISSQQSSQRTWGSREQPAVSQGSSEVRTEALHGPPLFPPHDSSYIHNQRSDPGNATVQRVALVPVVPRTCIVLSTLVTLPRYTRTMAALTETNEEDLFAGVLNLEDQYFTEGYDLGVADGSRAGRIEGRIFGLEKGFEKALAMGRLNGRASVWAARLPPTNAGSVRNGRDDGGVSHGSRDRQVASLSGSERLRKHIDRLVELTDPESLETKNDEDAVNEFDERVAGARAKATLISRIVGEVDDTSSRTSPNRSSRSEPGNAGDEVEITDARPTSSKGRGGDKKQTGEMEDFVGLPQARKTS